MIAQCPHLRKLSISLLKAGDSNRFSNLTIAEPLVDPKFRGLKDRENMKILG